MFFPFKDYKTFDHTFIDAGNSLAHTLTAKSFVVVEIIATSNSQSDPYSFTVYTNFSSPDLASLQLIDYVANGINGVGSSGSAIIPSGGQIWLNRSSQFGFTTIRVHVFELP